MTHQEEEEFELDFTDYEVRRRGDRSTLVCLNCSQVISVHSADCILNEFISSAFDHERREYRQ